MDSITVDWLVDCCFLCDKMYIIFDDVNRIKLQYLTDVSCLVKFSFCVVIAVTFMNLDADAVHAVGDATYVFIIVVDVICC